MCPALLWISSGLVRPWPRGGLVRPPLPWSLPSGGAVWVCVTRGAGAGAVGRAGAWPGAQGAVAVLSAVLRGGFVFSAVRSLLRVTE